MNGFVPGNSVVLLEGGSMFFSALVRAIESALEEIHLESYIFENDHTGRRVANALCDAARRGVRVHVLVDGFGGRSFVATLMSELVSAGVQVLVYRREIRAFSLRRHRLRRLHRKVCVVDAQLAFVGGINIVDDILPNGPPHPRHDYAVQVQGPLVREIVASARRLWWLVSWASLRRRREPSPVPRSGPVQPVAGPVRAAFLIRDNLRHRRDIEDAYLDAIAGAQSEIVIASAYFFPGRQFRQALTDAARRGVRVILILQGLSDHPVLAYASRALYPYFLSCGVRLFEYGQGILHAKVAVVDSRWATVGSSNIDPFSLLLAREANVMVEDEPFASQLRASLALAMLEGAEEHHLDSLRRLPLTRRLASWIAYQFVRAAIGIAGFGGRH